MAEPFNVEQFRQQMRGQTPQPAQSAPAAIMPPPAPQSFQAPHAQPNPYQSYPQQTQHVQQFQAPQFTAPPSQMGEPSVEAEAPTKKSRFSLKRVKKDKPAKASKVKKFKTAKDGDIDIAHKTKTSPAIIFMFGMATGIVAFLVGNMLMANVLNDQTAQNFREIERRNAQLQQPVLPGSAKVAEATPPARAE